MIGDLIRAYALGRDSRQRREPFAWQPGHLRPQLRTFYRLGWRDADRRASDGYPQIALALIVPEATLPLQSPTATANVVNVGNDMGAAR